MEKLKGKTKAKTQPKRTEPPRQWTRYTLMVQRTEKNESVPPYVVRDTLKSLAERIFDGAKIVKVEKVNIYSSSSIGL